MTTMWTMIRRAWLALATVVALSACSSSDNKNTADQDDAAAREAVRQQKDCADPEWKAAHLGVWYSVCRPNAGFR